MGFGGGVADDVIVVRPDDEEPCAELVSIFPLSFLFGIINLGCVDKKISIAKNRLKWEMINFCSKIHILLITF